MSIDSRFQQCDLIGDYPWDTSRPTRPGEMVNLPAPPKGLVFLTWLSPPRLTYFFATSPIAFAILGNLAMMWASTC